MIELSRERTVAAPAARVWELLTDFGGLARWASGVDHCCMLRDTDSPPRVGSQRRVQIGRNAVLETINEFAPPLALGYTIDGVPRRFSAAHRWVLHPRDDTTVVTVTCSVSTTAPLIRPVAERALARHLAQRCEALLQSLARATERIPS
ncbi:SRPBCC family protein [Mycobacterium sp. C3-094]